jgi:hypothetical protein
MSAFDVVRGPAACPNCNRSADSRCSSSTATRGSTRIGSVTCFVGAATTSALRVTRESSSRELVGHALTVERTTWTSTC